MSTQPGPTPPIVQPPNFNLTTAQLCATLTDTAYDQFAQWKTQGFPLPGSFRWVPNGPSTLTYSAALWGNAVVLGVSNWEPFGFAAADNQGNAYFAIRGTMTKADEWNDGDFSQTAYRPVTNPSFGSVCSGFHSIYTLNLSGSIPSLSIAAKAALARFNPRNVYITGHSLGAAMAVLAVPDVAYNLGASTLRSVALYNFAGPRAGDEIFANAMNNLLPRKLPSLLFRIVNTEDLVPTLPPAVSVNVYEHVGTPVSFTAQYGTTDGNHSIDTCYLYAIYNPNNPQGKVPAFVNYVTGFVGGTKYVPKELVIPAPVGGSPVAA